MKNLATLFTIILASKLLACGPDYSEDFSYFNLFTQEIIDDPQYFPFLLTYEEPYYTSRSTEESTNENIEDWQRILGISYSQAYYLVFKAQRESIRDLIKNKVTNDEKLKFITNEFIANKKQELLYLAYAKYLEPYMAYHYISSDDNWYYYDRPKKTANDLDYDKVLTVLTKSWNAETNKDLKLRYGYQIVRLAHYSNKFNTAIQYFKKYVESLDYKPIMYYYALDQKAGAERAIGNYMEANANFFEFFNHTKNRKESAYSSMKATQNLDFERMLLSAKSTNEKNNIYLLLGFRAFNNPINEIKKIIQNSPDAIQAKVLMARAINQIERHYFPESVYCNYNNDDCLNNLENHRLPIALDKTNQEFLQNALSISIQQQQNTKEPNFWNLSTAYLYFIQKDFTKAKEHLAKVKNNNELYQTQKEKMKMLIELLEQPTITKDFELTFFNKYKQYFEEKPTQSDYDSVYSTQLFINDILANRYFLQKEYAKAYLLHNDITELEYSPNLNLINDIERLYYKKNKNTWETYVANKIVPYVYIEDDGGLVKDKKFNFKDYVANMRGTIYLSNNELEKAQKEFEKVNDSFALIDFISTYDYGGSYEYITIQNPKEKGYYDGYSNISSNIFGFNKIECFNCSEDVVMQADFLSDFPFIKSKMNKRELTNALVQLKKIGNKNNELASKANYLLGNFYFNTTTIGYFRELLTFDTNNKKGPKFPDYSYNYYYYSSQKTPFVFYYKGYSWYATTYSDDFSTPIEYLEKSFSKAPSNEMKAQILFTLSKCEQGEFYNAFDTNTELKAIQERDRIEYMPYEEKEKLVLAVKTRQYRKYFKALKQYKNTAFYQEVKSNCKYFNYYTLNY